MLTLQNVICSLIILCRRFLNCIDSLPVYFNDIKSFFLATVCIIWGGINSSLENWKTSVSMTLLGNLFFNQIILSFSISSDIISQSEHI